MHLMLPIDLGQAVAEMLLCLIGAIGTLTSIVLTLK